MKFGDSVAGPLKILDNDWTITLKSPKRIKVRISKDWGSPCELTLPSFGQAGLPGPGGKADLFPIMKMRTFCTMVYAMQ